ncbi:MAG: hypothetical protein FJ387_24380 [Verrucomicrobia bacterium]|nr:hypothetical protein [Verrucomicrobiota bacterium]
MKPTRTEVRHGHRHPPAPAAAARRPARGRSAAWLVGVWLCGGWLVGRVDALDWPTYQHDYQRSGLTQESLEFPLVLAWVHSAKAPAPAWPDPPKADFYTAPPQAPLKPRLAFDRAHAVVAVGERVYYGSSSEHTINCLEARTGELVWRYFADGPVRLAPTVAAGRLYAGADDGVVYCLDAQDAALHWKYAAAGTNDYRVANNGTFVSPYAVRTSVAVDQGVAYFAAGFFPHEGVYLCAVDAATGTQRLPNHWQRKYVGSAALQGYLLLSPTRLYVPGSRSTPFYFDRASGGMVGQYAGAMGTYALLAGNSLFFGPAARGGGQLTEGSLSGDTLATYEQGNAIVVTATRSYLLTDTSLSALARPTRALLWTRAASYPYALILAGATLFAGGENEVAAFDTTSGNRIWTGAVQGRAYGLAVANGRLFVSTDTGHIYSYLQNQSSRQSLWILY